MKTLENYIDEFKERLKIESDYECANYLGVKRQQISAIRKGINSIGREKCMRIAEVLKINPIEIIATLELQKEKNPQIKMIWSKMIKMGREEREKKEKEAKKGTEAMDEKQTTKKKMIK